MHLKSIISIVISIKRWNIHENPVNQTYYQTSKSPKPIIFQRSKKRILYREYQHASYDIQIHT